MLLVPRCAAREVRRVAHDQIGALAERSITSLEVTVSRLPTPALPF